MSLRSTPPQILDRAGISPSKSLPIAFSPDRQKIYFFVKKNAMIAESAQ
jgi:hypothetical protein